MIRFMLVYAAALTIIGLNGLDSVERSVASHTAQIVHNAQ